MPSNTTQSELNTDEVKLEEAKTGEPKTKLYGLGVIVGRFQILHKGHSQIIKEAFKLCDHVGVLVGSSQESGTYKNPFSFEMRKEFLLQAFPDLDVQPLPDIGVGNNPIWGNYVLEQCQEKFGKIPDVFISGQEDRRVSWFGDEVKEVYVPKTIDISATRMKEFITGGDQASWNEYIEPALAGRYNLMREIIIETINNTDTSSL